MLDLNEEVCFNNVRMVEVRGYHELVLYEIDIGVLFEYKFASLEVSCSQIAHEIYFGETSY